MSGSEQKPISKRCAAADCGKTDVTEFSTCRHCGRPYTLKPWEREKQGADVGGFLRDPYKVLLALVVFGGIYYAVTKHNPGQVLGDALFAVAKTGGTIEQQTIAKETAVLNQNPDNVESRIRRADAYQTILNSRAALSDYNIAIELRPSAEFYNKRALAYDALGEYKKASQDRAQANSFRH